MLKVFIKSTDLNAPTPDVIASFTSDTTVPDSHYEGATAFLVPDAAVKSVVVNGIPRPQLVQGWREMNTHEVAEAEAARRIAAVFPPDQRIASVHELIDLVLAHGPDPTKWPPDAVARRSEIDRLWQYARDVNARAAANAANMPMNSASDKNWPPRIEASKA